MDTSHLLSASDLTDREWALLEPLLPPASPVGRPRLHSLRIIRTAIFSAVRTGGASRFPPHERPPGEKGVPQGGKRRRGAACGRPPTRPRGAAGGASGGGAP